MRLPPFKQRPDTWIAMFVVSFVALVFMMAGFSGRGNQEVPRTGSRVPDIPEEIKGEEGKEPEIVVFFHEEETRRTMPLEEYLKGVVAGEMHIDWPEEALGAQAIIARSFTLQKIEEKGGVPQREAHASTDIEEFQAYEEGAINEKVLKAVEKTRGQVAAYRGNYIRGWFHAFAGPKTALADEGLNFQGPNPPYIHIVESPGIEIVPEEEKYWQASFSLEEIRSAVEEITGEDPGTVEVLEISNEGPSGRATMFKVNQLTVPAPDLRIALGSTEMRSTFIDHLETGNGRASFQGTGYGHGVGMCQWGARALAEQGMEAGEILQYFYRDIDLVRVWE